MFIFILLFFLSFSKKKIYFFRKEIQKHTSALAVLWCYPVTPVAQE